MKSNFSIGFHPFQLVPSGSTSPQFASQGVEPSLVMRLCVIFDKELGRLRGHARGNPEDAGRPSAHAPPWSRTRKDVAVLQAEKGCIQTLGVSFCLEGHPGGGFTFGSLSNHTAQDPSKKTPLGRGRDGHQPPRGLRQPMRGFLSRGPLQ